MIRLSAALERVGATPDERRAVFLLWMTRNDWRQLELIELSDLLENITVAKGPSRSARWTGFITAPVTGQYIFSQLRQYRGDPVLRVKVGDAVVLDSTPTGNGPDGGSQDRFRSRPVSLSAGQRVAFQAETVLDENLLKYVTEPDVQFGAGLMWECDGLARQLITEKAFSPPQGSAGNGAAGLKGEYFEDVKMEKVLDTRLDPALDMFWVTVPNGT